MKNKDLFDLLETNKKSLIEDSEIIDHSNLFCIKDYLDVDMNTIKTTISSSILKMPNNFITGYDEFIHAEFCIGVTQFIDNLIMKYGLNNIQVLEHDYTYYKRLNPKINFAQIGSLKTKSPLIMSMPFAGHCDVHKQINDILDECLEKDIDVHLDCAWLTCADNITFDFSHPSIKSFASSLSKCYTLDWNRIGIRWSKELDNSDAITIYNNFGMYNKSLCKIGFHFLKKFPVNFYWQKYKKAYYYGCRETYTFPTKIIWLSKGVNGELYGTSKLLAHLHNIGMPN